MKNIYFIASIITTSLFLTGCSDENLQPSAKTIQSIKAEEAASHIKFTENAEIDNIKNRLELTSNPGQIGFILLMNEMGQPVMYTSVKGKVTSGSKRLTKPFQITRFDDHTTTYRYEVTESPSDEGTWGHSDSYVYFWTTEGQYIQWNGKYLYSDKPFRVRIEPLVLENKQ